MNLNARSSVIAPEVLHWIKAALLAVQAPILADEVCLLCRCQPWLPLSHEMLDQPGPTLRPNQVIRLRRQL